MPRLTFTGKANYNPVWAPDGKHIAYDASDGLWWVRADGAGEPQRLLESKGVGASSFSPDGRHLIYIGSSPETKYDILTLPLDLSDPEHPKPGKPEPFLSTPANELYATLSPDGRWMAYASNESGRYEVYVRPFPGPAGKWQISTGGAVHTVWSRDGRELFYGSSDSKLMVSEYTAKGDSFTYSRPRLWSDKPLRGGIRPYFDIAPDGKRFAVFPLPESVDEKSGNVHVTFLFNFFDEVRRRVPVGK
jgi:serine/threonine-protein kinase